MYVRTRRVKHGDSVYEYLDIVESTRIDGKVHQRTLGRLGRTQDLTPEKIDALITHLRRFASPQAAAQIGDVEMIASRQYGVTLVVHQLWRQLGLDSLLQALPQTAGVPVEDATFRMVVNRLCDPRSKEGLVDWVDEHENLHRGWQTSVQWPNGNQPLGYNQYLRVMDRLHPHRQEIEDALFPRVTDLLSLPLRLCLYDLTSSYFEGDGSCELAEYGYSRDHRDDRSQIVIGLAVTQEGVPITHRVFPGSTVDVTTLPQISAELRERFGLQETVIIGDRGLFSADNVADLALSRQPYILALRARQQEEAALAMDLVHDLPRPRAIDAPWQWQEVDVIPQVPGMLKLRHVVVYSAFKAEHDFEVRARRIRRALVELNKLRERAPKDSLTQTRLTELVTKCLTRNKCARYFTCSVGPGRLQIHLNRDEYREQRRFDGVFVLETNHQSMSAEEVVASYRQLMEVERTFRVLKSVLKLRPMYHRRDRRVETQVFICFLALLIGKLLEQRLRQAGITISIAHALQVLQELQAVESLWNGRANVVRRTNPSPQAAAILNALGIKLGSPILDVTYAAAA